MPIQMSRIFRGIVSQGVFQHLDSGTGCFCRNRTGCQRGSGTGNHSGTGGIQNSAALNLTISDASETYGRKDAVVIRLDKSSRAISIAVKTGTPAASPVAPSMTRKRNNIRNGPGICQCGSGSFQRDRDRQAV